VNAQRNLVIVGDALSELRRLPGAVADCCITSPPYFQLRDYGHPAQLGLEPDVEAWVSTLRQVFKEIARVLAPTGTLWLNVGDSYSSGKRFGAPAKSLLLGPERLLMALQADGWLPRNKVVWAKSNPMPTSARDRLNTTHEFVYFLVRQPDHYFDLDAIRVPHRSRRHVASSPLPIRRQPPSWSGPLAGSNSGLEQLKAKGEVGHPLGKNPGDVWTLATARSRLGHHASYPERLIERPVLAGCPERVCRNCGRGWRRLAAERIGHLAVMGELKPDCACGAGWRPGLVLDPFMGSGTTAVVARRLGRDWLGIEISSDFAAITERRLSERNQNRAA
jgi:site-specific DNA-methyltransferase (adenine-specific)